MQLGPLRMQLLLLDMRRLRRPIERVGPLHHVGTRCQSNKERSYCIPDTGNNHMVVPDVENDLFNDQTL
jgi:hypothetical protein